MGDELWDPPLRRSSTKLDFMFPFPHSILKTNISDGVKQNADPPLVTALDLCYAQKPPYPGTFRERTSIQDARLSASVNESNTPIFDECFGDQDASDSISTEDLDLLVGWRTCPMDGYGMIQGNNKLESGYHAVHKLAFDETKKISNHNTDPKSRALVNISSADLIHFASCTQTPNRNREDGKHCDRKSFTAELEENHGIFGEEIDFPNQIRCIENAGSSFVVNNLNVREKTADGRDATHFFAVRFQPELYSQEVENYAWFTSSKLLDAPCLDWLDLELGFMSLHGALERGLNDHKRASIQQKNLRFSASVERNKPLLTTRLGPPELSPSEAFGIAEWEIWQQSQDEARRRRMMVVDYEQEENDENQREPRIERFLKSPDTSYPVYDRKFRFYNSRLWDRNGFYEPGSTPPFNYISNQLERVNEISPVSETDNLIYNKFQLIQRKRREREENKPLEEKILRQRVIDK